MNILKIVLSNLISNALKFTEEEGVIEIKGFEDKTDLVITVQDNGIGMTESQIKNISISKGDSTIGVRNEKGTGLGLQTCKNLLKLHHNSEFEIASEPDVGTTVIIRIPMQKNMEAKPDLKMV